jgi:pimeloyl-ACP methyl ester carboxylesterase
VPVERLALLGHSMGGLVARSALFHGVQAQRGGPRWPHRVNDLVCLGTPHQGAPLERAGQGVDVLLAATPYAAPLARLGRMRSAGINDLRQGDIVSPDEAGRGTHKRAQVPLPASVRCYAVAGALGPADDGVKTALLGDGLVPVASALGQHREPARRLAFDADRQAVVPDTGHLALLGSAGVYAHLQRWLR